LKASTTSIITTTAAAATTTTTTTTTTSAITTDFSGFSVSTLLLSESHSVNALLQCYMQLYLSPSVVATILTNVVYCRLTYKTFFRR